MADFLEVVKNLEGDLQNTANLFNTREDGFSANSLRGNIGRGRRDPITYKHRLSEAIKLVTSVLEGRRHPIYLQEVMTTDDFPIYMADILDRSLLAKYQEWPVTWTSYAKRATVRDFRDAKLMKPMYGADGPLDVVLQGDQYPDAAIHEQEPLTYSVKKYGRRIPFTWETMINDDLDQLKDTPEILARAARRTEHRLVANLFVGASGPNTTLYAAPNENLITTANGSLNGDHPKLTVAGLTSAYNVMANMVDESGNPILREFYTLVVPPALEITAKNILNAIEILDSTILSGGQPDDHSGSGERTMRLNNWLRNNVQLVVDPYIPLLASTANGNTSWFLFANPGYSREAIRIAFLRGHESPEIWMKSPNAVRVGGGDVSPMSGDFDTDSIEYRVRHVLGAVQVDPKATVMSQGTGS